MSIQKCRKIREKYCAYLNEGKKQHTRNSGCQLTAAFIAGMLPASVFDCLFDISGLVSILLLCL